MRERMRVLRALLEKASGYDRNDDVRVDDAQTPLSGIVSRILHFE